jgi:beta-glucosidase/6-phospho-beta-glucosidase/beta-galactosidase
VERAVRDGYDVRGIMYWTLVDNFEVRCRRKLFLRFTCMTTQCDHAMMANMRNACRFQCQNTQFFRK